MIEICNGSDLKFFLRRVANAIDRYGEVTLCAPFIDDEVVQTLLPILGSKDRKHLSLRLITSAQSAGRIRSLSRSELLPRTNGIVVRHGLHAKIYLAVPRTGNSEAIVTSANLTRAGMLSNVELGIRAVSSTEAGNRLVHQIHHFVRRLAA